jgi:hypothetical protein
MRTRRLQRRLSEERGEAAIVSFLVLATGLLVPLMFVIVLFARIELAQLHAQQAARDAVRAAVEAPGPNAAHAAATAALAREQTGTNVPLALSLTGTYTRGAIMTANITTSVPVGTLPLLGHFGTITIHAHASAPVDRYRSILEGAP